MLDKYSFSDAIEAEMDVLMVESECDDLRIDFSNDDSIWLRNMTSVEGSVPKRIKPRLDKIIKVFGVKSDVKYY